ncbi:MAG: GspH/FimT family pseudopilin [Chitinophagaceae bacterium]|nr:GspH/FimT family pseudopilin [Rubrivivax sp.]
MKTQTFRSPVRIARGLSLLECLITTCVAVTVLGSAAPGFQQSLERRHLEGAAAQLETDLMAARSLAVARNQPLRVSFSRGAAGSCYVVHSGPAQSCDCQLPGPASCSAGSEAHASVFFKPAGPVQLQSNVGSIIFDPVKGTSTPAGTLRVVGRNGTAVHQVVNIMGRVRSCAPQPLSGYAAC